jgi:hypothetical protein
LAEKYLNRHHENYNDFLKDTTLINRLLSGTESAKEFSQQVSKHYGIFLYTVNVFGNTEMKFWSDQLIVPPAEMITENDGEYFLHLSNGWYYTIKKTISENTETGKVLSFAMIPVRSDFFIETDYLPKKFAYSSDADKRVVISEKNTDIKTIFYSEKVTEFPVKSSTGNIIFYLDKKVTTAVPYNDKQTLYLRFGALLFLFLFIHLLAESVSTKKGVWKGIGLLVILVLAIRISTYYFPFLLNLRQFELFDPAIYGSNPIQRSLGDLLINALFFTWIVLFAWSKLRYQQDSNKTFSEKKRWITGLLAL